MGKPRKQVIPDGRQYTLEEIGQTMGITRERVRQIEAKALKKLRVRCKANGYKFEELFPNLDR